MSDTSSEQVAADEALLASIVGKPTGRSTVVVERGPVAFFAQAVFDTKGVYRDPAAAAAAGLAGIPAPPTYPIALETWGKFDELQAGEPVANPMMEALGPLLARGGLMLHGEQEFEYHRPLVVGDVLDGEGSVVDAYRRESKGRAMYFVVTETRWSDHATGEPVVTARFNIIVRF